MKKITHKHLNDWLISIELLKVENLPDGKTRKMPTDEGIASGIITEMRTGSRGSYIAVLYELDAQRFIIDNIEAVMGLMNK